LIDTTFEKLLQKSNSISVVEFMYPLMQGYDSVALHADVELGGKTKLSTC
jgi:tyrosyl-tRNA synthetase